MFRVRNTNVHASPMRFPSCIVGSDQTPIGITLLAMWILHSRRDSTLSRHNFPQVFDMASIREPTILRKVDRTYCCNFSSNCTSDKLARQIQVLNSVPTTIRQDHPPTSLVRGRIQLSVSGRQYAYNAFFDRFLWPVARSKVSAPQRSSCPNRPTRLGLHRHTSCDGTSVEHW